MTLLLDTHVWLWMLAAPERLGKARAELEDADNELLLSAASSWEIATKHSLDRLSLPQPPELFVPDRIRASGVVPIPIEHVHALEAGRLPTHHRDPFDRDRRDRAGGRRRLGKACSARHAVPVVRSRSSPTGPPMPRVAMRSPSGRC